MATPHILIKKYENRRLYDTTHSRYVNLAEVAAMVRKGHDIKVVDASTGEDLTRSVLMQIIAEDNKEGPAGLPLELLRQLVIASDQVGREFLMWYLKSAFDAYGKVQQSFTSRLSDLQNAATSPVQTFRDLFRTSEQRTTEASRSGESEVEALRQRLAALEEQLRAKRTPKAPKKKRKSKKQS